MKAKIASFIDQLLPFDYLLFGALIALFILTLILALLLRRRRGLSITLVLLSFALITVGPFVGYQQLHAYLFKHSVTLSEFKRLEFSDALIVWGSIRNDSKRTFTRCEVTAEAYKVGHNAVLDLLYPLKPFRKGSILLDDNLSAGASRDFKIIVEPFYRSEDFNVSIGADCR